VRNDILDQDLPELGPPRKGTVMPTIDENDVREVIDPGVTVAWNGGPEIRIAIRDLAWRKRSPA
jgi:hypothetical protein